MPNPFLEERLPIDVRMGASYGDEYNVEITTTAGGDEHRRLVHPYPVRRFQVGYTLQTADLWARVLALYHRAYGMYAGFRVRCKDDFSTNAHTAAPTAADQTLTRLSAGVYQLRKAYGAGAAPIAVGLPERTLYKPVSGTVLIAVGALVYSSGFTVDTATGQVTFAANKTKNITGISKAASAVIGFGAAHTFVSGESVYISGVAGMTQINGQRGVITATGANDITVNINSTGYGTWTSGGVVNSQPQAAETVTGGCEFDLACRFNSRVDVAHASLAVREAQSVELIELLNP
jgi:uncharacterized protein (TIGR02217 family)